ncbi:unnamed protein product [Ectocarpus sp. CCAP 1310/34]|nr:unnamed protein product [Ectocarpus sp. CCAP 1310/34]
MDINDFTEPPFWEWERAEPIAGAESGAFTNAGKAAGSTIVADGSYGNRMAYAADAFSSLAKSSPFCRVAPRSSYRIGCFRETACVENKLKLRLSTTDTELHTHRRFLTIIILLKETKITATDGLHF